MGLQPEERELVIRVADDEQVLTCTSSSPRWTRHLKRVASKLGVEGSELSPDVYRVQLPTARLNLLIPKRRRVLTEVEKERARASLAKARSKTQAITVRNDT